MSVKVFGLQIANGYSPEAHVFASLLAHRDGNILNAHVLHHQWPGDEESARRFGAAAGVSPSTLDFGWRSVAASRPIVDKVRSRLRFLRSLPHACTLARDADPDIIYSSQQFWDCQAATRIARKLRRPQIIHLHYTVGPWLGKAVLRRLRTCDHVIAISDFIREEALRHGVPPERVTTIRNSIGLPLAGTAAVRCEVRRELNLPREALVLGTVARLDPEKGQAETIRAFARVAPHCPAAHLIVVGDETPWHPGYAERLRGMARELGVSERVSFLGRRGDVPRLLSSMDVFLHPSRQEPFGLAVAEAAAMGLPVIGCDEGGLREVIRQGVTGLLPPPGDDQALAEAMRRLLDDPPLRLRMGAAGRDYMKSSFTPSQAGVAFSALLRQF